MYSAFWVKSKRVEPLPNFHLNSLWSHEIKLKLTNKSLELHALSMFDQIAIVIIRVRIVIYLFINSFCKTIKDKNKIKY